MKISELKKLAANMEALIFQLPAGEYVPLHFHVTEIGLIQKHYIDCGGTIRSEQTISFQLWNANDYDHRLLPQKLLKIIAIAEQKLNISDLEVEVEYQSDTVGKYGLHFNGKVFQLVPKHTTCLAKENCGVPENKQKIKLSELKTEKQSCCNTPGCC